MLNLFCLKKANYLIVIGLLILSTKVSVAQNFYWVAFTDKNNTEFSLSHPEEYLSQRAIQRRIKQNIAIDSLDLPVNEQYIRQVLQLDAKFVHASKWLNGLTVKTVSDSFPNLVMQLPFIKNIQLTKPDVMDKSTFNKFAVTAKSNANQREIDSSFYGNSYNQVAQLNGQYLHGKQYFGQGVQIAVLDAGFLHVDNFSTFDSLRAENRILGTKDFVNPQSDFFSTHYHGMSVLSCMAGYIPGILVGTAPKASYWLLRSEDADSEYIIEEDNWVVAAEYADSAGADIINSSLSYSTYEDESTSHTYEDMDGNTTRVSIGAGVAASRGMLVFVSVGNEGADKWKYIAAPSDADDVLGIGAVTATGEPAYFTSYGPAFDGDVKPNASAMGWNTFLQKKDGSLNSGNGTSFSSPLLAGMVACLWQANPHASAIEIKLAIEQSSSLYPLADSLIGYGIPDMELADNILKSSFSPYNQKQQNWLVYPNPVQNYLILQNQSTNRNEDVTVSFYSLDGTLFRKEQKAGASKIIFNDLTSLPSGFLILKIESGRTTETIKLSKIR